MGWIRRNLKIIVPVVVVGAVVVGYLAFGVFGIQTLFFDDEVDEDVPAFSSGAGASGLESDEVGEEMTDEMNQEMLDEGTPAEVEATDPMPEMEVPVVMTVAEGSFVPRSHPGEGIAKVLNDGTDQRFLRFEDFSTDNGPDLNVYLTVADADADAGDFVANGEYIDLGDLKGNIGPQNYEIPPDADLERYDTAVVWCVRFGVAFTAADLVPTT
jgi:hypothetical protein